MIDEHAGELVADRFMDQHRGDGGIDAAGQAADHFALADLLADLLDRFLAEGAHGPVAGEACNLADEIADQLGAVGRMHHFGVEHQPVIFALLVLDHGERRIRRGAGDDEARRHLGDAVAMAHPDLMLLAHAPGGIEQLACGLDLDIGAAEFAVVAALDLAAELGRHGHLAVADAEHRHAGIEDRLRRARRALLVHRCRPAGEDHRLRLHRREGRFGLLERHDLGIDALLAHAARDQLRHLAAEIDDQNLVMRRGHRGRRRGCLGCGHASKCATGAGSQPQNRHGRASPGTDVIPGDAKHDRLDIPGSPLGAPECGGGVGAHHRADGTAAFPPYAVTRGARLARVSSDPLGPSSRGSPKRASASG